MAVVSMYRQTFLSFISVLFFLVELNSVNGVSPFANISDETGNNANLQSTDSRNKSALPNVTNNELNKETTAINTSAIPVLLTKNRTKTNMSRPRENEDVLVGFDGSSANATTETSDPTVSSHISTENSTPFPNTKLSTHVGDNVTSSPSHRVKSHHFNINILYYILIPAGCLLVIVISFLLVRHIQKVRRKRRLERELFHQYSYANSETDDFDEQNIESVVNTEFVPFGGRLDKNLYEDTLEVNLVFDETCKLVVNEAVPDEENQASTSFNS